MQDVATKGEIVMVLSMFRVLPTPFGNTFLMYVCLCVGLTSNKYCAPWTSATYRHNYILPTYILAIVKIGMYRLYRTRLCTG